MLRCEITAARAANDVDNNALAEAEDELHAAEMAEQRQQMIEGFQQRLRAGPIKREIATMESSARQSHASASIFASLVAPRAEERVHAVNHSHRLAANHEDGAT